MNYIDIILDVLKNSFLITGLVITMMLMIEFLNVKSHGKVFSKLKDSSIKQVITAACLGLIPGCIGGFAVVSLYTHKILSFGALVAMMISSSGDEAFVMLAIIPQSAFIIFGILIVVAIITGIVVDRVMKKRNKNFTCKQPYEIHDKEHNVFPSIFKLSSYKILRHSSVQRIVLIVGISIFATAILSGVLEHSHHAPDTELTAHINQETHSHSESSSEECTHAIVIGGIDIFSERWLNIIFGIISIITLLFIAVSNEHFIKEHLWDHVVKHHFFSVFLWTLGALLLLQIAINNWDMTLLIQDNIIIMIFIAVLVGVIPESGPHLFFITLFAGGIVPLSVLVANSIVQDGHTTLPLLAESKSTFIRAKVINMAVGLVVGLLIYSVGY